MCTGSFNFMFTYIIKAAIWSVGVLHVFILGGTCGGQLINKRNPNPQLAAPEVAERKKFTHTLPAGRGESAAHAGCQGSSRVACGISTLAILCKR